MSTRNSNETNSRCLEVFAKAHPWCSSYRISPAKHHENLVMDFLDFMFDLYNNEKEIKNHIQFLRIVTTDDNLGIFYNLSDYGYSDNGIRRSIDLKIIAIKQEANAENLIVNNDNNQDDIIEQPVCDPQLNQEDSPPKAKVMSDESLAALRALKSSICSNDNNYKRLFFLDDHAWCPGVAIDASHIVWFAAANEEKSIDPILFNRFRVFHIPPLSKEQMRVVANSVYRSLLAKEPWGEAFNSKLSEDVLDKISEMTPRDARKSIEQACAISASAGRREILVEDISSIIKKSKSIGF